MYAKLVLWDWGECSMGRKSIKENKTVYQISREKAGFTREEAGERMIYVTEDRLEKIENERTKARPEDVIEMSKCYDDPLLCNKHCTTICPIGITRVPVIEERDLSQLSVNIVNSINKVYAQKEQLIGIAAERNATETSLDELISISLELNRLSKDLESLKLFLRKELDGGI